MTAPLYFKHDHKTNKEESLPILTNRLLDAIDDNDWEKTRKYIDLALEHTVSLSYFSMLYKYAMADENASVCDYIRDIIIMISNTDI